MANTLTYYAIQQMPSNMLIEALLDAASERAILILDEAPSEELKNVQQKLDMIQENLLGRLAW